MEGNSNDSGENVCILIIPDNKNVVKSKKNRKKNYFLKCKYCCKEISKVNIRRHEKTCIKNKVKIKFICDKCQALFSRKEVLKQHTNKCNNVKRKGKKINCMYEDCQLSFPFKRSLIDHLKNYHEWKIKKPIDLKFVNVSEFEHWKDKEEEKTFSYYSKQYGIKKSKVADSAYFYCQHDGSTSRHKNKTSRKRKMGTLKQDKICISMIQLKVYKDGSCSVKYFPTHNHPLSITDFQFHPQSKQTYAFIDHQLALNVPPKEIVQACKLQKITENTSKLTKSQFITRNSVRLRANRQKKAVQNDGNSKSDFPQAKYPMDKDPKYKLLGEEFIVSQSKINDLQSANYLFMVGVQSEPEVQRALVVETSTIKILEGTQLGTEFDNRQKRLNIDHSYVSKDRNNENEQRIVNSSNSIENCKSKLDSLYKFDVHSGKLLSKINQIKPMSNNVNELMKTCKVLGSLTTPYLNKIDRMIKLTSKEQLKTQSSKFTKAKKQSFKSLGFVSLPKKVQIKEDHLIVLKEAADTEKTHTRQSYDYVQNGNRTIVDLDHNYYCTG